jgi:hypothetical protein
MAFRYEWRKMTNDGRLIDPNSIGDHYDRGPKINGYNGFETEQEAIDRLDNTDPSYYIGELVLVRFRRPKREQP